uniref:Uncharacterized protein n=1 Tax=Anopheles atroparvus TaxID=41427 RepID=A0A182ISQ8_ANOAO
MQSVDMAARENLKVAEHPCRSFTARMPDGKLMYFGRAHERRMELENDYEPNQGVNMYVSNLDDTIYDARLRLEFTPYGTITSTKVMVEDEGRYKGFGRSSSSSRLAPRKEERLQRIYQI